MPKQIVEDRTLARIALDVSGRQASAAAGEGCDIALGQAIVILRVLGITAGPEIVRTLRADIAMIFADPAALARAQGLSSRTDPGRAITPVSGRTSYAAAA